jgi:tRNA-specific 2-thiouridylase
MAVRNETKRVVAGMSGGVDSSVAVVLLLEQGYEVIGLTLKVWSEECAQRSEGLCCGPDAAQDARRVAHTLGIRHYVVNATEDFQRQVVQRFADEYRAGRTPNPCILCNQTTKFGTLIQYARNLDAPYVATGHYAQIDRTLPSGRTGLRRGRDARKDQSYFLFSLSQDQLAHTLLPLGDLTKEQTRAVAREHGLVTADKKESMEICFVPDYDYGRFLVDAGWVRKRRGEIVDLQGRVLGHHEGIEFFTIGQRKGLRVAAAHPLYVVGLDPANNRVRVGTAIDLERDGFLVERCNWIAFAEPLAPFHALAKIRYQHPGTPATVTPLPQGQAKVTLHHPQRAITPGQACVFYQEDCVVGGGWIATDS